MVNVRVFNNLSLDQSNGHHTNLNGCTIKHNEKDCHISSSHKGRVEGVNRGVTQGGVEFLVD